MKRYFAYIRVSTVKQGERGSSLQEQRSAIEAFAQRNDLKIAEWFEECETAAKQGRRMFVAMLSQLARGKADGIIIHKIDRGARNPHDWAKLGDLIDRGVDVHFVHDNVDLHSRGGRLSADIQAVVAADYIRNLRDEVKKGFYGRLKQGFYPLGAPVGYLDKGGGKKKEIDPIKGPLVRQAFELYATNRIGLDDLREELTRRGLTTRRGKPLTFNGVAYLLHNPFYMGIIRIDRTNETFAGLHEPIVPKQLFDRVQAVLAGKAHAKTRTHEFVFRQFARCAACGWNLTGERKKRRYVYYRCYNRTCRKSVVKEQAIDQAFQSIMQLMQLSKEELGDLGDLATELEANMEVDVSTRKNNLKMQLANNETRLTKLTDALLDDLITKEVFEERRLASLRDRQGLLNDLADPRLGQAPATTVLNYLELPLIKQIGAENTTPLEKREILESTCWNFVVDGKKLAIALKSPYREIAEWRLSTNGGPNRDTFGTRVRNLLDILIEAAKREITAPDTEDRSGVTYLSNADHQALAA